jgi:putative flippase GtrA
MAKQLRLAAATARLRRPSRYAQIGLLCALLNNLLVMVLDQLGFHYLVSVIASSLIVTVIGYVLHTTYTFDVPLSWTGLSRFMTANASGFLASLVLMTLLCGGLRLRASIALLIATVLLFFWNFLVANWAIAGLNARTIRARIGDRSVLLRDRRKASKGQSAG